MLIEPSIRTTLLEGQVAIVTGAAQGIGRATAETLAANGARVVLADLDETLVKEVAAGLGDHATYFGGDLVDPAVPDRLVAHAADAFGSVDIVVNAAGYFWDAVIHKMSDDQFQAMLDIHAVAPFRLVRAAAPFLRQLPVESEDGSPVRHRKVVNVSAIAASFGLAGGANYAAGKGALESFTKSLAIEWGRFHVNVNAVSFGPIATRFGAPRSANNTIRSGGNEVVLGIADKVLEARGGLAEDFDPESIYEARPTGTLFGTTGTIRDAADATFWLASPLSNFVTGQVVTVSGGQPGGLS
ncbi:SDR family oxidoreductase [Aeromicrobium sp. CFBP 8757]|uniref:SDR family NAD(P)-dependent oxidoreductase n=1 Tax=Aeromicrobium sp. CFBP 8757 TaxID=2775288 RepID=UPI00177D37E3|nr:SDR family oxidoreductase [Aeromicrobium sp. CFBP 8757]MBD8605444.1 SDR family oxidoreductase [Aeromicrobium sp. CFBP 8757]